MHRRCCTMGERRFNVQFEALDCDYDIVTLTVKRGYNAAADSSSVLPSSSKTNP